MNRIIDLRQLVAPEADRLLTNWGRWRRIPEGPDTFKSSPVFISGGISSEDAFDHLCEAADHHAAEIADAIIDGMEIVHKVVLQHVYEAAVWNLRRMAIEDQLLQASGVFLVEARKRGIA